MMKPQVEKVRGSRSDSKTGHWNHLKTCAFTGLLLAGPYPNVSQNIYTWALCVPLPLGFLTVWWLGPTGTCPRQPGGHWLDWPHESHSLACTVITRPFRVTGRKKGHHL